MGDLSVIEGILHLGAEANLTPISERQRKLCFETKVGIQAGNGWARCAVLGSPDLLAWTFEGQPGPPLAGIQAGGSLEAKTDFARPAQDHRQELSRRQLKNLLM
jgi:hypothetical protein